MESHIQKWGNSLALRIPIGIAKKLNLQSGSPVTLELENNQIIIKTSSYNLDEMLNQITPENQHHQGLEDLPYD